jgi:formate dehydrogenase major subunit
MGRSLLRRASATLERWPVLRQLAGEDPDRAAAASDHTRELRPRTDETRTVASVCPYCAVGCGTAVHVREGRVVDVEGDPRSPINQGTLCPKGADIFQYAVNPNRLTTTLYRAPRGTRWERVSLAWAMERIADRLQDTRDRTWTAADREGRPLRHTTAVGMLGGAALDNEENYLIKKLCVGLGVIGVENQARI